MPTDHELLGDYACAREGAEEAFAELVRRHVDLVYSAAMREARGDAAQAQDVTQAVFTELARSAGKLSGHPALAGWLYTCVRRMTANARRSDDRRRLREQEVMAMNELLSPEAPDAVWQEVQPVLDDAMHELSEAERAAVVLRYFEELSHREVGEALGLNESAARKRVDRALEKLRELLAKRGVTSSASGLVAALGTGAVFSAPSSLAATVTSGAIASAAAGGAGGTSVVTIIKFMSLSKLQVGIISAVVVAGLATPLVVQQHNNSARLQQEVETLRQQGGGGDVAGLKAENERLSNALAEATRTAQAAPMREAQAGGNDPATAELLRLRAQATRARSQAEELGQLRSNVAQRTQMDGAMSNAMVTGLDMAKSIQQRNVNGQIDRMKEKLKLTDEQTAAIKALKLKQVEERMQLAMDTMNGRMGGAAVNPAARTPDHTEAQVKALLSPEQLAAYPEYQRDEAVNSARESVTSEVSLMRQTLGLTPEQEEKMGPVLFDLQIKQQAAALAAPPSRNLNSGDIGALAQEQLEKQKQQIEQKVAALTPVLTPDQLEVYRKQQSRMVDVLAQSMKLLIPQTNGAAGR